MAVPAFLLTTGQLVGYAKLFWDTIGKDLAKSFGPDIIKAAWARFNGDSSQDSKLAIVDKKRLKDLDDLKQLKADITEYRVLKETLDPNYKGPKQWPAIQKQQEKRFRKLEKTMEGYYPKYPELRSMLQKNQFNEAVDIAKSEEKKVGQQADEAAKAIKEGKILQGQVTQPGPDALRFQQYSPEQAYALNQLSQLGLEGLRNNKFDFGPIEEQARTGFAQKTIPTIAERFSSMGSKGSQRSSAFPQLLGQAGSDLEKSLAAMKQDYNLRREGNFANMANIGLRPQFAHAGPLIGGLPQQQPSNIDKFAEALPGLLGGAGDFVSKLFNSRQQMQSQAQKDQSQELADLKKKLGGSYTSLRAIYPEAFAGKTVLPESYSPEKVTSIKALQALYPQAFGNVGYSNDEINRMMDSLNTGSGADFQ